MGRARHRRYVKAPTPVAPSPAPKPAVISDALLAESGARTEALANPFAPQGLDLHPPGVRPSKAMAMDAGFQPVSAWAGQWLAAAMHEGQVWLGWPLLSELAQRPEYRRMVQTIATEMTRRWIKIQAKGDGDKSEKVARIDDAFNRLKVRDRFREAAEHDGFFGGGHIFLDFGTTDPSELTTPIGNGTDQTSQAKVGRGSLKALRCVEPIWIYPQTYDTTNPLSADWYKPQEWYVMGKPVHRSRLLTLVGREVPDLLKPAYSFRGLSLTQIAKPYVDNWLRTRQSVADIVYKFSTNVLKLNMTEALNAGGGEGLIKRVKLFQNFRDNNGLLVLKKDATGEEDFINVSTPLGGLEALQAQAQEQMASVSGIPLVKLLGITPSGLNASSDGEVRVFYDWIHAYQEQLFSEALDRVFAFVQLSELGEVDPDLVYSFEPLWNLDEKEKAEVQKIHADTDAVLVETGILMPTECRKRIAADPETPYPGLDVDALPELPAGEEAMIDPAETDEVRGMPKPSVATNT